MTPANILRLRFENQYLARASFRKPEDVVTWFGAMQAQDYLGSLWAIGLRMRKASESSVEAAESRRAIIRTWPMRGTLHFVAAVDARWMTRLLAPRVIARNAARLKREVDVDASVVARARDIVARALEGGRRLERAAVYETLEARRIRTANSRGLHILLCLAMEGTLCLAGRQGKQQTFALLDEWVPDCRSFERDEALAELAQRYFSSHGPATLQDFMWWAGIPAKDAEAGVDGAQRRLVRENIDGRSYWMAARRTHPKPAPAPIVKLLPAYDEYTVAYRDRSHLLGGMARRVSASFGLLSPVVVVDGQVAGSWKRTIARGEVRIATRLHRTLRPAEKDALHAEMEKYENFLVRLGTPGEQASS
jgi:winged helix DNA-binding protein